MTAQRFTVSTDFSYTNDTVGASIKPTLLLDFARSKKSDLRLTTVRSGVATRINETGYIESVSANTARINFDPTTKECLGLLVEEARTNVIQNSNGGSYTSTGTATAPDRSTAYKAVPSGSVSFANVGSFANQAFTNSTLEGVTTDYTFSGYFSSYGTLNYKPYIVIAALPTALYALVVFNPITGTFSNKTLNTGWSEVIAPAATLHPCGMWCVTWTVRYTQQPTLRTSIQCYLQILNEANLQSYTADGVSGFQYACMQFEEGIGASSYIPTTTASVTRSSDIISYSTSTWFNATEGTLFADFVYGDDVSSSRVVDLFGTFDDRISLLGSNGAMTSGPYLEVRTGAVTIVTLTSPTPVARSRHLIVGAYRENDFAYCDNGGAVIVDTSGTLPTVNTLYIGTVGGSNPLGGHIKKIAYYPKKLSNEELKAITTL